MKASSRRTEGGTEGLGRRDELLRAIAGYFEEVGFQGFSFRGAAKASDISTMTLARHFGNLDGLLDALMEKQLENVSAMVNAWPKPTGRGPVADLRAFLRTKNCPLFDSSVGNAWQEMSSHFESASATPAMRALNRKLYLNGRSVFESILENHGWKKGEAHQVAGALYTALRGANRDFRVHGDRAMAIQDCMQVLDWVEASLKR